MTLDDVKRVFHATPPEFAPYLEYAYYIQEGYFEAANRAETSLDPDLRTIVSTSPDSLARDVRKAMTEIIYLGDTVGDLLKYSLMWQRFLAFMGVRESETVQGRLAYYQSIERRQTNTLTPIKIRRFLTKYDVFNEWGERQGEMQEIFSRYLDNAWDKTDTLDVRTLDHDDVDGWDEAFNKIRSCMSRISEHGVGVRNSYLCYMTKHHGLDDNGVRLTVLYQDGKPVARTLTYENECGKYFVRNYGDDRLVRWLDDNGYEHAGTLPLGTLLYTWVYDGSDRDEDYAHDLVHPYLDGANNRAELITENGKLAFVIQNEGDELADATGSFGIDHMPQCCSHCEAFADTKTYPKYLSNPRSIYFVYLCEDCEKGNVVTVDAGTPHEKTVYSKYLGRDVSVYDHDGGTFTLQGLQHLGFTVVDDNVVPESDTATCFVSGGTFLKENLVDISDYPQVVLDTYEQRDVPPMAHLVRLRNYGDALTYIPHPVTGSAYARYTGTSQLHTHDRVEHVLDVHLPDVMAYIADGTVQGALLEYPLLLDLAKRAKAYRDDGDTSFAKARQQIISDHLLKLMTTQDFIDAYRNTPLHWRKPELY